MPKIFISNPSDKMDFFSERAVNALSPYAELVFNRHHYDLETPELIEAARDCDMIIAFRQTVGEAALFAKLPKLAAFLRCAVDIRTIDVPAASAQGVLVTQTTRAHHAPVSEWIIGCMIDLSRQITAGVIAYREGHEPAHHMGRELRGSMLGVIGYGEIAQYLVRLALALGMRVTVFDPYKEIDDAHIVQADTLAGMLAQCDYVVCLAVATAETEKLLNAKTFAQMKPGAFFVNASRGNLVDEDALLAVLDGGHLGGCALDVGRAQDQKPSLCLAQHAKVVASPHIGGSTPQAADHQALDTVAQAKSILRGEVPVGAVNAQAATRFLRFRPTSG